MAAATTTTNLSGSGDLQTPTLESEQADLLQRISEHGGYAYVRMASLAASGDFRAAEAARELAWEQLHSGPWHSVLPVWRDAYSMACIHVAKFHHKSGEFKEALRVLDLGLIMGGSLLRRDLDSGIEQISQALANSATDVELSGGRLVGEEFNLAEALQVLPKGSLSSRTVMRRTGLSLEGFLCDYLLSGFPVVISDCMAHWPARTRWNDIDYLQRVAGDRTVPVEDSDAANCMKMVLILLILVDILQQVGKNYLCSEWKQELITFSQFLERIHSTQLTSAGPTYLAQHQLFDQACMNYSCLGGSYWIITIRELRKDILIPDYCFAGGGELRSLNAWFGPAGTVTPLHHDPHHNILAQVVGRKYVRLYPASISEELYPHAESMLSNSSQVDLDCIDEKQFPKALDMEFLDCILEEGEMLYIPPKWWHYVRSLTTSFSVSFWWSESPSSPLS
ncbi:Cupin-like domain 8 [Dillenia turbinata]|uniref:Cupin-like domain 8 n=1 Tax=Dillenia turbinata TaxID=194707 RepID=A0AAN8VWL2_9MAGN